MRARRRAARRLALAALLAAGPLGGTCGGGTGESVELGFAPSFAETSVGAPVQVDVEARLGPHELQAFELAVAPDASGVLVVSGAQPHADFDDDGALFLAPTASGEGLFGIVDLRHGAAPATGDVRLVRLEITPSAAGEVTLHLQATGLATPEGGGLPVTRGALRVRVSP